MSESSRSASRLSTEAFILILRLKAIYNLLQWRVKYLERGAAFKKLLVCFVVVAVMWEIHASNHLSSSK
eukprot:scaffold4420_cov135-Skeletonema_dohrnii-CCMP3373.AAC.5